MKAEELELMVKFAEITNEYVNKEIHEFLIKYFKKNPELKPDSWKE